MFIHKALAGINVIRRRPFGCGPELEDYCPAAFMSELCASGLSPAPSISRRLVKRRFSRLASVYGNIVADAAGTLSTTGLRRTGCVFCAFGIHMDLHDGPKTRFELLRESHPRLWDYVINRLGLGDVLRYCRDTTPMPSLARRIRWGEV